MLLIYTTHPDKQTADSISQILLKEQLVACVHYSTIEACLIWKGEQTTEQEVVALYKTSDKVVKALESRFLELHPYEIPCFIVIEATANASYEAWIEESTKLQS